MKCTVANLLTGIRDDKGTKLWTSCHGLKGNGDRHGIPNLLRICAEPVDLKHPQRKTDILIFSPLEAQVQSNPCNRSSILSCKMYLRASKLLPGITKRAKDKKIGGIALNDKGVLGKGGFQKKSKEVVRRIEVLPHI